jgi:ABC-2 type transport system permease protein
MTFAPEYRFELVKLLAQWRIRVLIVASCAAPLLLVAILGHQSNLPTDTLFGRWLGQSGWAGSLVVLSFCCSWVLPVLTSLVAGDVFASEDRLGTWRHMLVTVRSPRRIFVAKALASVTVLSVLTAGLAASGIVGGLLAVGNRPLVGLDGHSLGPASASVMVGLAWATVVAPTLAFAAVGLLGSVALGRSPIGLLAPALLGLLLQGAQLLPLPVAVRVALPSYAFVAWRGLFTDPAQATGLVVGVAVCLVWTAVATALAYRMFMRRDFSDVTYDGCGRRALAHAVLPLAGLLAVTAAVVAGVSPVGGTGLDRAAVETSLATAYGHLYRLQLRELHRPDTTEQQLQSLASCDKGGTTVEDTGPGNDWRCTVSWHIPGATTAGSATYQLDVTADGRYVADGDGPQDVNGFFRVHTPTGAAPNPLWQFDGYVDLLTTTSKG